MKKERKMNFEDSLKILWREKKRKQETKSYNGVPVKDFRNDVANQFWGDIYIYIQRRWKRKLKNMSTAKANEEITEKLI